MILIISRNDCNDATGSSSNNAINLRVATNNESTDPAIELAPLQDASIDRSSAWRIKRRRSSAIVGPLLFAKLEVDILRQIGSEC